MPEGLDPDTQRKLRAVASAPQLVSYRAPRREPIPANRQAVAVESFTASDGTYVRAGNVYADGHPVVKANKRLFHRPAQPLEA